MAKETLDSHKINYLIWRYLIDSDYRETAVRLQKEWNEPDPQELPFAKHVENHSLVALLNKGLLYNVQEREAFQTRDASGALVGFFGPLTPASPVPDEDFEENLRKRQNDHESPRDQSGPPGKKPRLSNGYENGFDPNAMDVDEEQNGDENAYPSPEQLPSPVVTIGAEQGTQLDKVHELSAETTFLELSDDPSSKSTVLLHCEFNPRDPTILAAAGTDALARMWTLARVMPDTGSDSPGKLVFAPHHNLLDENTPASTTVTALSWSSDGLNIALSSEPTDDSTAKVEFWHSDGSKYTSFNCFESPVICLHWNPSNTVCLGLSPQSGDKGTKITVMKPTMEEHEVYVLSDHMLSEQPLEAVWTSDDEFVLCGGDMLQSFQFLERVIPGRKYETPDSEGLSKVAYDWRSRLLATASDIGNIHIWDSTGHCRSFPAHQGSITALSWQPVKFPPTSTDESIRLLASSGEDGAVSVWNARTSEGKSRCSMTMGSAVVALAFTPDGAFIAAGTSQQVFVWKVDDTNIPRATWTRGDELGWRTPQSQSSSAEEDQFSLCWNAEGQRLAYGVNSRLAIIHFRR
jgi:WD40 repeat protein